jgi:pimeloyl-ACP methyl ester carboxylesterase
MHLISLAWIGALLAIAAPVSSPSAAELSECHLPELAEAARCGVLDVAENPDRPEGRHLPIAVAVVPATGAHVRPDPIVVLMGGPGEDAIGGGAIEVQRLARLRTDHDLLLVDQRGTGRSAALHCRLYSDENPAASLRDLFPLDAVARCVKELSARADLTQYGYARFASDLEHVRRALGYGSLDLFAGSYGTRAAQVYMRAYPGSVRTVYLGSTDPMDVPMPLPFGQPAQAALESLFSACSADPACHAAFPALADQFAQILARLETGAVRVSLPRRADPVPLARGRVAEWIRSRLYRPRSAAVLPWMIHRAFEGDWSPIADAILADARGADSDLSFGLFFSITCSEDVAFIPEERIEPETRGTFLGDWRVRQQQAACRLWPKFSPAPGYRAVVHSEIPVLLVSGDTDGAMPLWYAHHVAPGFPNGVEIVLHGLGHTEWSECIARRYEQFVRTGVARGLDSPPCDPVPRPAFKTR